MLSTFTKGDLSLTINININDYNIYRVYVVCISYIINNGKSSEKVICKKVAIIFTCKKTSLPQTAKFDSLNVFFAVLIL